MPDGDSPQNFTAALAGTTESSTCSSQKYSLPAPMSKLRSRAVAAVAIAVPALVVYVVAYFVLSKTTDSPIDGGLPDERWVSRQFGSAWQLRFFKPLLFAEDVMRDGDFDFRAAHSR